MKKSPMQMVKDAYGSKDELVKQLLPKLGKKEDESKTEFGERIKKLSNTRLLHLMRTINEVNERFGSKNSLVDEILKRVRGEGSKEDKDYRAGLVGKSHAELLSLHRRFAKKPARKG